ncbi:MAG: hypothetical protein IPK02_18145 [Candidatus Accumulibacter sp.]|uniref:Uncharacterized protein n=1 Tax=Candidatus Accumulibacter affinis TaxID=2954384 RepID=A0A935TDG7_9PROT|nr:hypothetical protein [Candidatus Accumulibacter affinis]
MEDLAQQIAERVISDTKYFSAVIGLIGAIIGSILTLGGNVFLHWLKERPTRELDSRRKKLLRKMLSDQRFKGGWRKLTTLSRVIGADDTTTTRLLIEIGARGSEKDDSLWGLIENHPFNETDQ